MAPHCWRKVEEKLPLRRAAEGGEGPDRVVAQDNDGVGEIDFECSGFEGKDATKGLPADLV